MSDNLGKKLMQVIDRAISGPEPVAAAKPIPPKPSIHVEVSVYKALCEGRKPLTAEQRDKFRAVGGRCKNRDEYAMRHIDSVASEKWVKEQASRREIIAQGRGGSLDSEQGWSRQDWIDDFREVRKGLSRDNANDVATLAPELETVAKTISGYAGIEAAELAKTEDAIAARFGVAHKSPLRGLLESIAAHPTAIVPHIGGSNPKTLLEVFGISID